MAGYKLPQPNSNRFKKSEEHLQYARPVLKSRIKAVNGPDLLLMVRKLRINGQNG